MEKLSPVIKRKSIDLSTKFYRFKKNYLNSLYMLPVILGIIIFTIIPMGLALVYSFCEMDLLDPYWELSSPSFEFYKIAFTSRFDEMSKAYFVTFRQVLVVNVISLIGSYVIALILNQKIKGMGAFKIIYYLPCLLPGLASSLLWTGLTSETGFFNQVLITLGFNPYTWYYSNDTAFKTILILSGFGFSGNMIMWLAQLKNIPNDLYEEAKLSGASKIKQLFNITIPMSTSMVFYLIIMSIIGTLQSLSYYTQFIESEKTVTELKYVGTLIYEVAYVEYKISYACALSWILFAVIGVFTILVFTTSRKWVYYAEDN